MTNGDMGGIGGERDRRAFLRDLGVAAAATGVPLGAAQRAQAADATGAPLCPHPNPIVHENRCTDPGTFSTAFQVASNSSAVVGYARRPSVNVGESIDLVVTGPNLWLPDPPEAPAETVEVDVYRLGYYDGRGGRRVWQSTGGPISTFQKLDATGKPSRNGTRPDWSPNDPATGLLGQSRDRTIVTVPGSALKTSGVYLAKLKGKWIDFPPGVPSVARSGESHIVFVVRDDARPRDVLVMLPTNTWQAYNYHESRSLYTNLSRYDNAGSIVPATGTERAAKVSLDRAYNNWAGETNWVLRTEFPVIWWLERHGYDVAYTEDTAFHFAPEQGLPAHSRALAVLGHSEYWTAGMRDGFEAARDAGTNVYNFGANTCYWRTRYETVAGKPAKTLAEARVMVCYKVIEGGGTTAMTVPGQDDPVEPTTTWRDPGKGPGIATPGTVGTTPAAYRGAARPEESLFGIQYFGDDDMAYRGLGIPPDSGDGEFAGHRAWRHTAVPAGGTTIGTRLVGWEWDGVTAPGQPFGGAPTTGSGTGGVRRMSRTTPHENAPSVAAAAYLLDAGRAYTVRGAGASVPPGWNADANAVTYTAPSGALVFSAGTIQWSWGLGPHYLDQNVVQNYSSPRVDSTEPVIIQATTNLLADGGVLPLTPEGLLFDPPPSDPPAAEPSPVPAPAPATASSAPAANPADAAKPATPATPVALKYSLSTSKVSSTTGLVTGTITASAAVRQRMAGTIELHIGEDQVGRASFAIGAGKRSATVRLRLTKVGRKALAKHTRVKPLLRLRVTTPKGVPVARQRLTLTRRRS